MIITRNYAKLLYRQWRARYVGVVIMGGLQYAEIWRKDINEKQFYLLA